MKTKKKGFAPFKKERFQPELTILDMRLRDAKIETKRKQRELSVVIQKTLPQSIITLNNALSLMKRSRNCKIELDDNNQIIINNLKKYNRLTEIFVRSKAARIMAVHKVLTNKGYRSPGITTKDHPKTNDEYVEVVEWLKAKVSRPKEYKTSPLDRIYLLKTNKTNVYPNVVKPSKELGDTYAKEKNLRPISIPSIRDRCLQAVYYLSYIVYSEYVADPNSYAFRPGRSPAWAANSLTITLRRPRGSPKWILEIDIAKCYDNINHKFIINNTPGIPSIILKKWLKQGYILRNHEEIGPFETISGIPQGGIISPAICNTVLDGADEFIRTELWRRIDNLMIPKDKTGYKLLLKNKSQKLFKLYRYADDIVITANSKFMAIQCKEILEVFLEKRGLALSIEKTKLTDVSGNTAYFEFIGFGFKKIYVQATNKTKWVVIAPQNSISRIRKKLQTLCHSKISIKRLFYDFSCILRSWVGYYSSSNISKTLSILNLWVYKIFYLTLFKKIKKTNTIRLKNYKNKNKTGKHKIKKIGKKYIHHLINVYYIKPVRYHTYYKMKWYVTKLGKDNRIKRFVLFSPRIFKLIKQDQMLTTQNLNYFNKEDIIRISRINLNYKFGVRRRVLLKNFKNYNSELTCPSCLETFENAGRYEFHHKLPVFYGGETSETNLIILCKECHLEISKAVLKKDANLVEEFIRRDLLIIPEKELNNYN